ncbi:MAG: hypothetical protein ABIL09_11095 [Gemmatimonadota bacterium]
MIRVMMDGEELFVISNIRDATWDSGLVEDVDNYLGELWPRVTGTNNEERIELTSVPNSSYWQSVVELQRRKNEGDETAMESVINVTFSIDHKNGDYTRRLLPDCTLVGGGLATGGRTEKVTTNPTFVCGRGRQL